MKKSIKTITIFLTMILFALSMHNSAYAMLADNVLEPNAVSRISVIAERTTLTNVDVIVTGSASSKASSIIMTATLYEYNAGKLTKADISPVTQTIRNSTTFEFDTSFEIESDKIYKVKIVVKDTTKGVTTTTSKTSSSF